MGGAGGGSRAFKSVLKEEMGQGMFEGSLERDFENFQEDTPKQQGF